MNPDHIKGLIEANFEAIVPEDRKGGWAFYFMEVRKGPDSTRIARAIRRRASGPVYFKLSVSSRINNGAEEVVVNPTSEQVRALFARELALWKEHYS
jgi:hypothetical protein